MRLTSLEARDFRRFRSLRFEKLPLEGIIGIVGENESGKTTLGEAVSFALFGRTVRVEEENLRELIRWGEEACSVSLGLELGGTAYRVERELDRDGSYTARLLDGAGAELARGVGRVRRALSEVLPLSFDEFRYSFFLGQKELESVEHDDESKRRGIFDRMIGVDRIDGLREGLEGEIVALERQRGHLEGEATLAGQLADCYESEPERVEALRIELGALDARLDERRREARTCEERESSLVEKARKASSLRLFARWMRLRAGARWLMAALDGMKSIREELRRRVASERSEWEKLSRAAGRYARFRECLGELERIVSLRGEVVDVELRDELGEDEAGVPVAGSRREALVLSERRLGQLGSEGRAVRLRMLGWLGAAVLVLLLSLVGVLHFQLVRAWTGVVASVTLFAGGIWCFSHWRQIGVERRRLDAHREILAEEVQRLESIRQACDGFGLGDPDACEEAVAHMGHPRLTDLMERLRSEFEEFWTVEAMKPGFGDCLEATRDNALKSWEGTRSELDEIEVRVHGLDGRVQALTRSPFGPEGVPAGALRLERSDLPRFVEGLSAEVDEVQKRLGMVEAAGTDPAALGLPEDPEACRNCWEELREDEDGLVRPDWDALARAFDGVTLDGDWRSRADRAEAELLAATPDEMRFDGWRASAARASQEARAALREVEGQQRERAQACRTLEPGVAKGVELRQRAQQAGRDLKALDHDLAVRRLLAESFDDLASRMRKRFAPAVASHVGRILPALTCGRYERIEMDEGLNPRVYSTERGEFVPIHVLSGGTVDQLMLSLRLAFSESLTRTKLGERPSQMLFLDEPLMSFDDERTRGFLELMRREHGQFAQVFVVSHRPGLELQFDVVIATSMAENCLELTQEEAAVDSGD